MSFRLPLPLTEGFRLRVYNIARLLAQNYKVDLLSLYEGQVPEPFRVQLGEVFDRIVLFRLSPLQARVRAIAALGTSLPLQVRYHYSSEAHQWLQENYLHYDALFCAHLRMAQYVESVPKPRVIDLIDATSSLYRNAARYSSGIWKAIYTLEANRLFPYELRMLDGFAKVFITSRYDADYIVSRYGSSLPDNRLVVLPNGIRESLFCDSNDPQTNNRQASNSIVFLGKMDYAPNVDAALRFCQFNWPTLRSANKTLKFYIVGTSPRPKVQALSKMQGVEVTGYVDDPFSYLRKARLVIAPLRYAAGIQNKVLEAMALGKPIVVTPSAVQGIVGTSGKHFVVADEASFAGEIIRLLGDQARRRYLSENAAKLARMHYRWHFVGRNLLKHMQDVLPQQEAD